MVSPRIALLTRTAAVAGLTTCARPASESDRRSEIQRVLDTCLQSVKIADVALYSGQPAPSQ
jgi:hypothetical protein